MTKDTIIQELYKDVRKLFLFQSDTFQNSGPIRKSLEEMIYVEIIIVEKLLEEATNLESHTTICHGDMNTNGLCKPGTYLLDISILKNT